MRSRISPLRSRCTCRSICRTTLEPGTALGEAHELALGIGEVILEEADAVPLKAFRTDEGVVPLWSESCVHCNTVDAPTFPSAKLDRQLSLLFESSRMEAEQATIAR